MVLWVVVLRQRGEGLMVQTLHCIDGKTDADRWTVDLGYDWGETRFPLPHLVFPARAFPTRLGSTAVRAAEGQKPQWLDWTELAFLGFENGNLLGVPFFPKGLGNTLICSWKDASNFIAYSPFCPEWYPSFCWWVVSEFGLSCPTPVPASSKEVNLTLWGNTQKQARSLGCWDSSPPALCWGVWPLQLSCRLSVCWKIAHPNPGSKSK